MCAGKAATREKRVKVAKAILADLEAGQYGIRVIWRGDECWFDTSGSRWSAQNDRVSGAAGARKNDPDMRDALAQPTKQRAPGAMARMTVSAFQGGSILAPHLVPAGLNLNADYYKGNILLNDVLPKIRAKVMGTSSQAKWVFMQDLAPCHTAKSTAKLLSDQAVRLLEWAPKGADVNPLDVFVWDSIKNHLRTTPLRSATRRQSSRRRLLRPHRSSKPAQNGADKSAKRASQ